MACVLVVEDTQDSFDLIADALEEAHEIVHARTGPEGLALARLLVPAVILLDMSLPELDGFAVARHLKADRRLAAIPVVAITAHAMQGDRERCRAAGCDDYLAKPVNIRDLAALVERHVGHRATA